MYIPINQYKVLVRCFTYNHSSYISDALAGFAMQQTDFPFICLVMDDNSTDGEQQVLREWLEKECDMKHAENTDTLTCNVVVAPHKNNSNCTFAFYFLKQNLYKERQKKFEHIKPWRECCEYEAICEGDDYWTDPLKLQKQVDWLDVHPEYSMCFSNAIEHWESKNKLDTFFSSIEDRDYTGLEIYAEWIVPTASVLYRYEVIENDFYHKLVEDKRIYMGDTPLFMSCAKFGKVRGMSDVMTVYRRNEGGVTMTQNYSQKYRLGQYYIALYEHFGEKLKKLMKAKVTHLYIQTYIVSCMDKCNHIQWYFLWDSFKISAILTIKELSHHIVRFIRKRV